MKNDRKTSIARLQRKRKKYELLTDDQRETKKQSVNETRRKRKKTKDSVCDGTTALRSPATRKNGNIEESTIRNEGSENKRRDFRVIENIANQPLEKLYVDSVLGCFDKRIKDIVIDRLENVVADGNCGYRCCAELLGLSSVDGWKIVRNRMLLELRQHKELHMTMLGAEYYQEVEKALDYFQPCPSQCTYWMQFPDMGCLFATAFNCVLCVLSPNQYCTYLPLRLGPPEEINYVQMVLHNNNHFLKFFWKDGAPIPPLMPGWKQLRYPGANPWEEIIAYRLKKWEHLIPFPSIGSVTTSSKNGSIIDLEKSNETERDKSPLLSFEQENRKNQLLIKGEEASNEKDVKKKKSKPWLLNGRIISYEREGKIYYDPACSKIHVLRKPTLCPHCDAIKFQYEPPSFCCQNGQVKLAPTDVLPELYSLLTSNSPDAKEFQKSIRAYNSIFSFTSLGVKLDKNLASAKKGVYTFRAQGQVYHNLPALKPQKNGPCYFQLYFYDTQNEIANRMGKIGEDNLSTTIVQKVMQILQGNPYAEFLRTLEGFNPIENLRIHIRKNVSLDQRRYNSPTADQVAAIWVEGNDPLSEIQSDIVIHAHSGENHRVKHYFSCYDPLQYPLLFPKGELGWHQNIDKCIVNKKSSKGSQSTAQAKFSSAEDIINQEQQDAIKLNNKKVSCRAYYSYRFQIRQPEKSILLLAGRLLQQYAVDMYIKLETTRLDYFRTSQSYIRSDLYQSVIDSVIKGETRGSEVGKRIVLPASFVGGPRDMRRRYLDSIALVQKYGKPDLFITMTCNPEWEEIQNQLKERQLPQDRPDLTARIFRAKLEELKNDIFKKKIFGGVAAHVHVIEFQKRGLPHAHMLIILKPKYKIKNTDDFDKYVSAELPDENKHPELHNLVKKHMMHGPCGQKNKNNPCMINGKCKNHYPRSFCEKTTQGKDGYPIYRRRNDKNTVEVRHATLDNRWVVPYNPYLLSKYNCHINVEICSGLKAVKYLYKYIYKGHDRVAIYVSHGEGDEMVDEIKHFQDARWVSAQEAMWRIFEFNLNEMYPAVINLPLHLPNKQSVSYHQNQNLESILNFDHISKTMLTEFFTTCSQNEEARKYLYRQFPEKYVWDNQGRVWKKRIKRDVIGRINGANPAEGERYYLRILLNQVTGPTSFNYLLNASGTKCATFKESAIKLGLLESDNSIIECLNDAVAFQMPYALRRLFATILVYCEPTDIKSLWDDFFEQLSEDFERNEQTSVNMVISSTLKSINSFLESMGKNIKNYDLPSIPKEDMIDDEEYSREMRDEMSVNIPLEDCSAKSNLNQEQQYAFDSILHKVDNKESGVFFIDGPGGTGKTYLYRTLLAHLR